MTDPKAKANSKSRRFIFPALEGGERTIDPSENVKALSEAAANRQDDLRVASERRLDDLRNTDIKWLERLHEKESESIRNLQATHTAYQEKLNLAEAKRIDAIRAVDVSAVAVAADRASAQATVLANQVAASAEALRALVASTQASLQTTLQNIVNTLTERLSAVEKTMYENKGKSGVADPILEQLMSEVRMIKVNQVQGVGQGEGKKTAYGVIAAAIAAGATIIGTFISIAVYLSRHA